MYSEKDPKLLALDQMIAFHFANMSRLLSSKVMRVNSWFHPISQVTKQPEIWAAKKGVVFDSLKRIADLLKENIMQQMREDEKKFDMLFYTQKTHVEVAMLFRDIDEAIKVLKNLKYTCDEMLKLKYKIYIYSQLGYCYRIM